MNHLTVTLVNFDNGNTPESMQCYVLVTGLDKKQMKDKGGTVLDVGNWLYRKFGISYEMCPEYHRSGEAKNSLAFYISKERFNSDRNKHVREFILAHDKTKHRPESVLFDKRRIDIPNVEKAA